MARRRKGGGLANETDFLELYRELGVSPGCCLLDFKRAYRRHVARLHPDRRGDGQPRVGDQLQQLTAQYSAAMEFQRRHGRLPGAQAEEVRINTPEPALRSTLPPLGPTREQKHGTSKVTILFALSVLAALFWCTDPLPFLPEVSHTPYIAQSTAEIPETPAVSMLVLGMSIFPSNALRGLRSRGESCAKAIEPSAMTTANPAPARWKRVDERNDTLRLRCSRKFKVKLLKS